MMHEVAMLSLVRRALDRLRANRAPWQDYVIGAGLAFDPLPSRRRPYEDSDRIALAADLLQLVRDRDAVVAVGGPNAATIVARLLDRMDRGTRG
jgi:hypothetical protein